MTYRNATPRGQSGFTLVELMIVMVTLGILVGIVGFAVGSVDDAASDTVNTANLRICRTATAMAQATASTVDTYQDFLEDPIACP